MLGALIKIILAGGVVVGAGVVMVAVVPTPGACTTDVVLPEVTDVQAKWDSFVSGVAPDRVGFDEAEVTVTLRDALETAGETGVSDVMVHFCGDGTAQLAFTYSVGPVPVHGLAKGTIPAGSPLRLVVDELVIGGLPTALTDPAVEAARDLIDRVTSFDLEGPIDRVEVLQGSVTVYNE